MAQYATCECFICHQLIPKPEAYRVTVQRESGHSSGSFRFSRRSTSYYTGRTYYRNKEVWLCSNCYPEYRRQKRIQSVTTGVITVAILGGFIWIINQPTKPKESAATNATYRASTETRPLNQAASFVRVDEPKPTHTILPTIPLPKDTMKIQNRLIELGYLQGSADGIWGPKSKQALLAFKISNNLAPDDNFDTSVSEQIFSVNNTRGPWATK